MSVTEIESAIAQLPPKEFSELMSWLQKYQEKAWDKQIEEDLASGRLDTLVEEAEKEYRQGLSQPL